MKIKSKTINIDDIYYAVIDDGSLVADGSQRLAIYFDRRGANEWRKDMLGKDGKVVKVEIKLLYEKLKAKE